MKLQVLIAAYGPEEIKNLAGHPKVDGVEYIVSWQKGSSDRIPPELKERDDFRIFLTDTVGISRNRNEAFSHADADCVILSDSDLEYTPEHLKAAKEAFEKNPEADILTFRYRSDANPRSYPEKEFDLATPPKGYFITSFEIGFNLRQIQKRRGGLDDLRFNHNFGINGTVAEFICGEEDLLIADLLKKGYKGKYLPVETAIHPDATTGMRMQGNPDFIATKGACMLRIKPLSWPLRMLVHALRSSRGAGSSRISFGKYCRYWLRGVKLARKNRVFTT